MHKNYLSIDIGASSGRHIVGWMENGVLRTEEVYRFPNSVQRVDGHLEWDIDSLFANVKQGIREAFAKYPNIESLSIDTWAVDYVLLKDGKPLTGVALTMAAFSHNIGPIGSYIVSIGIILFAYSTILGWEYNGEKAWEYLFGTHKYNMIYRVVFSLVVYIGATQTLDLVWNLSDIANALMAIPNLISMLILAPVVKEEVFRFQAVIEREKAEKAAAKEAAIEERAGI